MLSNHANLGLDVGLKSTGIATQTGLAADPAGLKNIAQSARNGNQAGLEAAARAFESLLVGQMLRQMRSASVGSGLFESSQSQLYQDLHDQQTASLLSEGEGLGIRKALLRQLAPELSDERGERDPEDLQVPERNEWLRSLKRRKVDAEAQDVTAKGTADAIGVTPNRRLKGSGTANQEPRGQWPPDNAEDFVAYLKPYADQAAETLGMDTSILLAQSALETGWGRHVPRRSDGSSSFNLFGIKADRSWDGDRVSVGTLEYRNGVARREQAKFRAYSSPADSFIDYVAFLHRNPRYRKALASESAEAFIHGLQQAGYATDPKYAAKVLSIRDRMARLSGGSEIQVSSAAADRNPEG